MNRRRNEFFRNSPLEDPPNTADTLVHNPPAPTRVDELLANSLQSQGTELCGKRVTINFAYVPLEQGVCVAG